ncbi:glycosyltransferase family 4 protein [Vibrio sp. 10N.286.48.C11]|uniref:glycosyltransferase family 4 protein n=1 Tax=Vibrio sp. 10N.286.48.C11 TaxID=3229698 RepID=UPI0035534D3B
MNNTYDYVFITNLPAFYKINLYNKLSEELNIRVVFISKSSSIRMSDFMKGEINFDYDVICNGNFEERNKLVCLYRLLIILSSIQFKKIVYPGWELIELIPLMVMLGKNRNSMVIESSIKESRTSGLVWNVKKFLINRMSILFPSGKLQCDIVDKSGFEGDVVLTHGVGIPSRDASRFYREIMDRLIGKDDIKYLYVGRLSQEKNLEFLVRYFNNSNKSLSIVGNGKDEELLKRIAGSNVKLLGYIPNEELHHIYRDHDCFIIPSLSEPWGLVVDEALWNGMPVIASSQVGCAYDMVTSVQSGLVFEPDCFSSLDKAINNLEVNYLHYLSNVNDIDFSVRDANQVRAYISVIK